MPLKCFNIIQSNLLLQLCCVRICYSSINQKKTCFVSMTIQGLNSILFAIFLKKTSLLFEYIFSWPDPNIHVRYYHHSSSFPVNFYILIFSETTGPSGTKLGLNVHWKILNKEFICFCWSEVHKVHKGNKRPKCVKKGVGFVCGTFIFHSKVFFLYGPYKILFILYANMILISIYYFYLSYSWWIKFHGNIYSKYVTKDSYHSWWYDWMVCKSIFKFMHYESDNNLSIGLLRCIYTVKIFLQIRFKLSIHMFQTQIWQSLHVVTYAWFVHQILEQHFIAVQG
jgi:hypothetical protein